VALPCSIDFDVERLRAEVQALAQMLAS